MSISSGLSPLPHHGVSRLVLAMSAWSVKTRRAPSRHCTRVRRRCAFRDLLPYDGAIFYFNRCHSIGAPRATRRV